MSREIKFRHIKPDGNVEFEQLNREMSDGYIEQYTGLKDRNGKEIYEGDIVTPEYDLENIESEDCYVIAFSNGCFRVGNGYVNEAGSYLSDWQVIGNIHENSELLGGKNV